MLAMIGMYLYVRTGKLSRKNAPKDGWLAHEAELVNVARR